MTLEEEIKQQRFQSEFHKLAVNILYTHGWLVSQFNAALKPHGLTIAQFNILRILRGQRPHPASITLLQERMLDKMSDTSRLVERLRSKGLLRRTADPADRRRVAVEITAEGLAMLDLIGEFEDVMRPIRGRLTEEEAVMVNAALDALRG